MATLTASENSVNTNDRRCDGWWPRGKRTEISHEAEKLLSAGVSERAAAKQLGVPWRAARIA